MAEKNPEKLQKPLMDKNGSFYPLTTYDQIIMPDNSRWDGKTLEETVTSVNGYKPDQNGNVKIENIDASTFNGLTLEELKNLIMSEAVYQ